MLASITKYCSKEIINLFTFSFALFESPLQQVTSSTHCAIFCAAIALLFCLLSYCIFPKKIFRNSLCVKKVRPLSIVFIANIFPILLFDLRSSLFFNHAYTFLFIYMWLIYYLCFASAFLYSILERSEFVKKNLPSSRTSFSFYDFDDLTLYI